MHAEGMTTGETILGLIILVVSIVIGSSIVNGVYRLFMKLTGADGMFYNVKFKVLAIIIVSALVFGVLGSIFGLGG